MNSSSTPTAASIVKSIVCRIGGRLKATASFLVAMLAAISLTSIGNALPVVAVDGGGGAVVQTTLVNFTGTSGANPGWSPFGSLVQADDGNFYGMTIRGGTSDRGTVFKLTAAGVRTTLVDFTGNSGANPGAFPTGSLVQAGDGHFYGTTQQGGTGNLGTVFKVTAAGVRTTLVNFTGTSGANPGQSPSGSLVEAGDGNFYGMTQGGGVSDFGTVFKLTASGVQTTLVEFTGTSGANPGSSPYGSLVQAGDGNFYGTTESGGMGSNGGTVFKLTAAGMRTTLVDFTGISGADPGSFPRASLVQAGDGNFYGTTQQGGTGNLGTVFKLTAAGVRTTLVDFTGNSGANPGRSPFGSLVQADDGNFYGMTESGGTDTRGTVFRLASPAAVITAPVDCPVIQTGTFSDADGNATMTLSASSGTITPDNAAGTWSWTATGTTPGSTTVTITATDSFGESVTTSFTFTVTAASATTGDPLNGPQLTVGEGQIGITFQGIPGACYHLQRSTELVIWQPLATLVAPTNGILSFTDTTPPVGSAYYRMKLP